MDWSPVVNGLHLGQLVEIIGAPPSLRSNIGDDDNPNARRGQLTNYLPDNDQLTISMMDTGDVIHVDREFVVPASVQQEVSEDGFDIVIGPRTDRGALGETMSSCLSERGFCTLKIIQDRASCETCFDMLKETEAEGKFGRLAKEVEEGYLGKNGRAKVMWFDPEDSTLPESSLVHANDTTITNLAAILSQYTEDAVGAPIAERTPALVCLSMSDSDEVEYESPLASDQMIEEYYSTWCRSVLRVIHFMGPAKGKASLSMKENAPVSNLEETYEINASANTILIMREDTFNYTYEEPERGETCWLQAFLMRQGPQWTMGDLEGFTGIFETVGDGPPPPNNAEGNLTAVVSIAIQSCGNMMDHHKEWAAYTAGTDGQLEMPYQRYDYLPYYSDELDFPQGTTFVKHFSVQEGVELFDNRTFEISHAEADGMDPICRQVLEVGYLSIFPLGYTKKYSNTNPTHASVSVGNDKQEWLNMPGIPRAVSTNQLAIMSNRFNYVFNLKGGSFTLDTACSSSLVGMHLGKMNLLESRWQPLDWHLGMGAGMTLTVFCAIGSCAQHMLSPGGRCFTFNATANGYNRGDGTAAMVIKKGAQDEQRIAYLRGTQIGQDGRSASMSAPNGPAQEKCVWGALREAQMTPPESTTWECHGTGTSLGDPIEVGAVKRVQVKMKRQEPLMIASSKSNFGHLEGSAAAMAMNKCVMIVIHATCAPTVHLKTLNPHLDHSAFDAIFITELNPYKYRQGHCQVSSFGVGGTNGHAIFWGESHKEQADSRKQFLDKIKSLPPPIIAIGNDPSKWEFKGMSFDPTPGEGYQVIYSKDPITGEESITYESVSDAEPPEFYSSTGNFNNWVDDRMMEGDVPGLFYQEVEMPDNGELHFRILAEADQDRAIGPEKTTSLMNTPMIGPKADVDTFWSVQGEPGACFRIEFLAPASKAMRGFRTIMCFELK